MLQRITAAVLLFGVATGTCERHTSSAGHGAAETWSAIHDADQPCPRLAHLDAALVETNPPCAACLRRWQGGGGLFQLAASLSPPSRQRAASLAATWQPTTVPYRISVPRAPPLV